MEAADWTTGVDRLIVRIGWRLLAEEVGEAVQKGSGRWGLGSVYKAGVIRSDGGCE